MLVGLLLSSDLSVACVPLCSSLNTAHNSNYYYSVGAMALELTLAQSLAIVTLGRMGPFFQTISDTGTYPTFGGEEMHCTVCHTATLKRRPVHV
jgi:hypothetical protein